MTTKNYWFAVTLAFGALVSTGANASADTEERTDIASHTYETLATHDYTSAEKVAESYRVGKARTASGMWKLTSFYWGVGSGLYASTPKDSDRYTQAESLAKSWAKQYPGSPTPHLAYSRMLMNHAWAVRGEGAVGAVAPDALALFDTYVELARLNLETNKAVAAADPMWYQTMLTIARVQKWEPLRFNKLLTEAVAREPLYYPNYLEALEYLLPTWAGNFNAVESFAYWATVKTQVQDGKAMYARVIRYAALPQFHLGALAEPVINWPALKESFEDLVAKYPDDGNLSSYARFSCIAKDHAKAQEVVKRLSDKLDVLAWETAEQARNCQVWALENSASRAAE